MVMPFSAELFRVIMTNFGFQSCSVTGLKLCLWWEPLGRRLCEVLKTNSHRLKAHCTDGLFEGQRHVICHLLCQISTPGVENSVSKQKNRAHRQNNGKCSVCVCAVCAQTLSLSRVISDSGSYLHKELSVTLPVLKS